jgi:Galactose-3-O-sulfotransferase
MHSLGSRRGTPRSRRCIVFLHVPKTGGSTLRAVLRFKYPGRHLFLHDPSEQMQKFRAVPVQDRRAARVVAGHLLYGVHQHIPQESDYITVLREPVARAISNYNGILRRPGHWFHDELVRSGMGLEEFAQAKAGPADNLQTRYVSGRRSGEYLSSGPSGRLEPTALGAAALEDAKRNLERFLVVGVTERFDESFILIRRALGWRLPMYATRNDAKAEPGPSPEPPTQTAIDLFRTRDQLDLELYDHAQRLLSAAVDRQGPSFRSELAAFRTLNRIPNAIGPRIPAPVRHSLASVLGR